MKKTIKIIALGLLMVAGTQSWAQEQGQIRASASLAMGTKAAINDAGDNKLGMGINIGGDYFVIDKLSISPSYTFFFKSTYGSSVDLGGAELSLKSSSFNIDGKYYFLTDAVKVYGLFGISFATAKVTADYFGTPIDVKDNKTGINIGGGVDYFLSDKLYLNGQLKYNTPLEQLAIGIGVGYVIK